MRYEGSLGVHHFAFLRSALLGLDLKQAWDRYLASSESAADARSVERRRDELLRRVLEAGHALDRSLAPAQRIGDALALLRRSRAIGGGATALPPLDQFVADQGLDREFYSEAELLREYREHYHLDSASVPGVARPEAADARVRALFRVEAVLARPAAAEDRVEAWFAPAVAAALRAAGCTTLAQLRDFVNARGYRWFREVPKLGVVRARAVVEWLAAACDGFERGVDVAAQRPPPPRPALVAAAAPRRLANDRDAAAIDAWLDRHAPATRRAYSKEIERFRLWLRELRGKSSLAQVCAADCEAYARFLAAVPADWINRQPLARSDAKWRPFRGPLAPSSQRQALVVLRLFLGEALVAPPSPPPASSPRAPVAALIDSARQQAAAPRASAADRRLLLTLLLARAGVSPPHLATLTEAAIDRRAGPPSLLVGRERIDLDPETVLLLDAHVADAATTLPFPRPLVCRLHPSPARWHADGSGRLRLEAPAAAAGALSAGGIVRAMQRFRRRCGEFSGSPTTL